MALPVTVVIPTYNRAELLRSALESTRAQRPEPPAEVIVVDDHSTEDVRSTAEAYSARVIRHGVNRGETHADNTGIREATQPWIAFLDSDDEWLPGCLESLWRGRGDHVLVSGKSVAIGTGPSAGRVGLPASDNPFVLDSPADVVFPENLVAASGVMVRRDVMVEAGCFDTRLKDAVDLDLWLRVLERGTGVILPDVVVRYRLHAGQATANRARTMEKHEAILLSYRDRPWWTPQLVDSWRAVMHWDDIRSGIRDRDPAAVRQSAAWLASHPHQWPKLGRLMTERRKQRRLSAPRGASSAPGL